MRTLAIALTIGALALAAWHVRAEPEVFRWVDDNGIVHYSDRPTDPAAQPTGLVYSNTDPDRIREQRLREWETGQQAAEQGGERMEEAERRRVSDAERARQREMGCQAARQRLERYATAHRLYEELPDGERRYLTSEEIDEERELAAIDVENWCD
jgi:hypothetical protein